MSVTFRFDQQQRSIQMLRARYISSTGEHPLRIKQHASVTFTDARLTMAASQPHDPLGRVVNNEKVLTRMQKCGAPRALEVT